MNCGFELQLPIALFIVALTNVVFQRVYFTVCYRDSVHAENVGPHNIMNLTLCA